jgi:hypothetical protein
MSSKRLRQPGDQVWYYDSKVQTLKHGHIKEVKRTYCEREDKEDEVIDSAYYVQVGGTHHLGVEEYSLFDSKAQFIEKTIG